MTIDEAIQFHQKEEEIQNRLYGSEWVNEKDKLHCLEYAEHEKQLVEWLEELRAKRLLMDKVCAELAELYGSPCDYSPQVDYMIENGSCKDCCGELSDKECWFRYFHRKFNFGIVKK